MRCPNCGNPYFRTVHASDNTDDQDQINAIYKKRQCNDCGHIWKTIEVPFENDVFNLTPTGFCPRPSKSRSKPDRSDAGYEFCNHKKKAIQAARELCYDQNVIDQLEEATSTFMVDQIMKAARKASLDG